MKKKPFHLTPDMRRPLLYQVFTRIVMALFLVMLWKHFVAGMPASWGFSVAAAFYGVMAWMAYLRLDGLKAPKFDRKLFRRKKRPNITYGDMSDYTDEDPITFDDLQDDEKDLCLLIADLICLAVFLILSLLV